MSLKAFHIVFVVMSILLSTGFCLWAIRQYLDVKYSGYLAVSVGALVFAAALFWYGVWFLRKLKDVSFL